MGYSPIDNFRVTPHASYRFGIQGQVQNPIPSDEQCDDEEILPPGSIRGMKKQYEF